MKIYLILYFVFISSIIKAENDSCSINNDNDSAFKIQVASTDILNEQIFSSNKKSPRNR